MKRINILGSNISEVNFNSLINIVKNFIQKEEKETNYICVSNVHTVVTGYFDETFKNITNNSLLSIPDGMPLALIGKLRGYKNIERCSGPDLMNKIFELSDTEKIAHYFYGSTEENLLELRKKLKEKYPKLNIVGMYSPPFRSLTNNEEKQIIAKINSLKPDIIWVGLGAPKQELWMSRNKDKLNSCLLIGVGAAFNFHSGLVKRAPIWMQNLALEWLYRLLQEPKRLFKRYAITNSLFVILLIKERLKNILH